MKLSSEVKVGVIGIIVIFLIFWGVKYLLGSNLFKSTHRYYALYETVDGLEAAAPVLMKGFKIGSVAEVQFHQAKEPSFVVGIDIEKKIRIPLGSSADIFSADLLGSKALRITTSKAQEFHEPRDTLNSEIVQDMLSSVMNSLSPVMNNIERLTSTLDSVGISLYNVLNDPATKGTILDLNEAAASLKHSLSDDGDIAESLENLSAISGSLRDQNDKIAASIGNIEAITRDIEQSDLDSILGNLEAVSLSLKSVSGKIDSGSGTVGKLINDDELYQNLTSLSADLDSLILDLKNNPEKYVQFSVFGK